MKKAYIFIIFMLFILLFSGYSQEPGVFSLYLTPGGIIPFPITLRGEEEPTDYYKPGGGGGLKGEYILPSAPFIITGGGIDYVLARRIEETTLSDKIDSFLSLSAKAGFIFNITPNFSCGLTGSAGYSLTFGDEIGSGPFAGGEAGFSFRINKNISLGLNASYNHYWYIYDDTESGRSLWPSFQGLGINLGTRISFSGQKESKLEIKDIQFFPVFPVFYKYYDENPIGEVVIKNTEKGTIKDVKVSFFIKQYMDQPKLCTTVKELKNNEEKKIFIYALFTDNVLGITEGTKVLTEIQVEYKYRDENQKGTSVESMKIQNRNAMTWDDDKKAAAFVTAKDPTILKFAKNIVGATRDKGSKAININFRYAFALFEALRIYNINYIIDPTTPFAEYSKQNMAVDFLQFPRQTLEYKAGDCDDLSILYTSLLEAIGIETAFLTIPGHIFIAFSTDINETKGKKLFKNPDNLIYHNGKTWVPVEITMIQKGFIKAWETGAKEWRDGESKGATGFHSIHEAWKLYEPVGFAKDEKEIPAQDMNKITTLYEKELEMFVEQDIEERVKKLNAQISSANKPEKLINKLGVLYAKYGLLDKAEKEFLKLVNKKDNLSALINLANIYYIRADYQQAINYYTMAYKQKSKHAVVLIGLAKAHYEMENYGTVKKIYSELEAVSPELAGKYGYLASKDTDSGRAFSQVIKEEVEWDDE